MNLWKTVRRPGFLIYVDVTNYYYLEYYIAQTVSQVKSQESRARIPEESLLCIRIKKQY